MTEPVQSQNTLLRSVRDQAKAWINRVRVGRAQFASSLPQNSVGVGTLVTYAPLSAGGLPVITEARFPGTDPTPTIYGAALAHDALACAWSEAWNRDTGASNTSWATTLVMHNGAGASFVPTTLAPAAGAPAVYTTPFGQVTAFPVQILPRAIVAKTTDEFEVIAGYLCNTPVVNGRAPFLQKATEGYATPTNPNYQSIWLRVTDLTQAMVDDGYEFSVTTSGDTTRYRIIGFWFEEA